MEKNFFGFFKQTPSVFSRFLSRNFSLLFISMFLLSSLQAQQLTINEFTGASACPTNGNSFSTVANATLLPLSRNTATCDAAENVFNSTTLNNTASRKNDNYIEFRITVNAGFNLNLSSLSFFRRASNTAPNSLIVSFSTDADAANFNTTRVDMAVSTTPTSGSVLTWNFPSAITVTNGGTVTFRFYPFGTTRADGGAEPSAATGTFRLDDVRLFGTVSTLNPNITLSKSALSFGTLGQNSVNAIQSYNVTGVNLTNDINLTTVAPYFISTSATGPFGTNLTLPQSGGNVNTTVFVREITSNTGALTGLISHESTGATTQNITLSGTITAPLTTFSTIAEARAAALGTVNTVQGYVTVSTQFGGNQIFIQDATGGISLFSSAENLASVYGLQLGDFVQVKGTRTAFNGLDQLGTPFTFQKNNTPPSVQTPLDITSGQMAANEGRLVRILNLSNPAGTTTFAANTNYSFGLQDVRITSNNGSNTLVGTTINAGTSNVTGIAGVFNSTTQLLPRFVEDIVFVNNNVNFGDDLNYGTNDKLDVGAWNIEWLGHPTEGPSNNTLQVNNAVTVLNTLKLDVINVNEISSETSLAAIVTGLNSIAPLPGQTAATYAYTCSQEVSNVTLAEDPLSQRVCFIYNTAVLKNVTTTALMTDVKANPANFFPNPTLGYPEYPNNDPANFWASGRLPYALTADVTIGSTTKRMMFVGLHAKANTAPTDISYQRRILDSRVFKDRLERDYPNTPFIVMGDYNDDIDVTIFDNMSVSSYKNFVDDVADFRFLTGQTSLTGRTKSTVSFNEMIDHIKISNEIFPAYQPSSARVGTPDFYIGNYGNTTSDHYPVMARFDISAIVLPVTLLDFKAKKIEQNVHELVWKVADEKNFKQYVVERSANGFDFSAIKAIKAANQNSYQILDNQPLKGMNYYRLKMEDNDGTYKYSKVVSVENYSINKSVKIYPNPSSTAFFVENISNPATGGTEGGNFSTAKIYNLNGQLVKSVLNTNRVDITDLTNGLYILEILLNDNTIVREKMMKQ